MEEHTFSDKYKFNRFGSDGKSYVRRQPNKKFDSRYTKITVKYGGGSIIAWACFSWYSVGPTHLIVGIMTKETNRGVLSNVMYPHADGNTPSIWLFQQDNIPRHTSKCVKDWFQGNNVNVSS
ncbi:hypothetical protein Trydic_g11033 [Trypoxylus dichotomus]